MSHRLSSNDVDLPEMYQGACLAVLLVTRELCRALNLVSRFSFMNYATQSWILLHLLGTTIRPEPIHQCGGKSSVEIHYPLAEETIRGGDIFLIGRNRRNVHGIWHDQSAGAFGI